jgi:aspartyl-tRNA(Asn)/glutamyl-tRNA(Gln) amidotransferase subunit A
VLAGERLPTETVGGALRAAREHADLGAFWSLAEERALRRAEKLGSAAGATSVLPLAGMPLAVKDNLDLAGMPTTGGLRGAHPVASADATAVERLEAAGAVAIGKTAMDPLAWSTHGQAEGFAPCLNPLDRLLSPGGSSSGSAVAVAAGIAPLALGTDTGGSVRIPASFCGITALKPGLDDVPTEGCLPLARSFDTIGVLATSVADCATAYHALTGGGVSTGEAVSTGETAAVRVGVLTDLFEASDPSVADSCARILPALEAAGVVLEEVRLDWWAPGFGLLLAVEFAEAWGAQATQEPNRFPPRILDALARAGTIDPERHRQVQSELIEARAVLATRLRHLAALLSPTVPVPVPPLEEEEVETSTRFTRIFNALGWPALSVPCGHDERGRPVGMQIASARGVSDALAVAARIEGCAAGLSPR